MKNIKKQVSVALFATAALNISLTAGMPVAQANTRCIVGGRIIPPTDPRYNDLCNPHQGPGNPQLDIKISDPPAIERPDDELQENPVRVPTPKVGPVRVPRPKVDPSVNSRPKIQPSPTVNDGADYRSR